MPNTYVDRDRLKQSLRIDASSTGLNFQFDIIAEAVSRLFDNYLGFPVFPSSAVQFYTAYDALHLSLEQPLISVDAIDLSFNVGTSYDVAMAVGQFNLTPYNAPTESPPRPYWDIEVKLNATTVFPQGWPKAVRITGTWGYFNEHAPTTATLATAINSAVTAIQLNGATALHPGQTILMNTEMMFVTATPTSSTGAHTSGITVQRGMNGTSAIAHTSGAIIEVYSYPVIEQAALYQAGMDYRAQDAPLGFSGGEPFGNQRLNGVGGIHPFCKMMLDGFRMPEAV